MLFIITDNSTLNLKKEKNIVKIISGKKPLIIVIMGIKIEKTQYVVPIFAIAI